MKKEIEPKTINTCIGVFRVLSNIYDGAFFSKIANGF